MLGQMPFSKLMTQPQPKLQRDTFLLKMRVIGPIYQCLFREETCYRVDIRLPYLKTIPDLTQKLAEEIAGDKGVKLADQNECAPIWAIFTSHYENARPGRENKGGCCQRSTSISRTSFKKWEMRGRGWKVFHQPVSPETLATRSQGQGVWPDSRPADFGNASGTFSPTNFGKYSAEGAALWPPQKSKIEKTRFGSPKLKRSETASRQFCRLFKIPKQGKLTA
jgi:hypothetical protein